MYDKNIDNLFFQYERKKIIAEQQKYKEDGKSCASVGFEKLAKIISKRWKNIDPVYKKELERQAKDEKLKYKGAVQAWRKARNMKEKVVPLETIVINTFSAVGVQDSMGNMNIPFNVGASLDAAENASTSYAQYTYHSPNASYSQSNLSSPNLFGGHRGPRSFH